MRDAIRKIIENTSATFIDLRNLNIKDDELREIAQEIVKLQPNAKQIHFYKNNITDKGAVILFQVLSQLNSLTFIDLQFNQLSRNGIKHILHLMETNPSIAFGFHGNQIIDQGEMNRLQETIKKKVRK